MKERVRLRVRARRQIPEFRSAYNKSKRDYNDSLKRNDIKGYKMKMLLTSARGRARRKGLVFAITETDFPGWRDLVNCPVFPWVEFNWHNRKACDDSPSIDRIDNSLGYIAGNVRIICWRANSLKADFTDKEISAIAADHGARHSR